VSTLDRRNGTPIPVVGVKGFHGSFPIPLSEFTFHIGGSGQGAANGGGGGNSRGHQCVRPPLPCRPSKLRLDVEAHRSPDESLIGVHAQAHRASRLAAIRRPRQ